MTRKAFLHVGTPKSGTTFLQQVVWGQRDLLAEHGLVLPGKPTAHVAAARQLRARRGALPGPWKRLVKQADRADGDVLISREALSSCPPRRAAMGVRSLTRAGFEVHVVVTARDLARQWPASWQEQVKSGRTETFAEYVDRLRASAAGAGPLAWAHVDAAEVVRLWGEALDGHYERVHLVTVPPPGAPAGVLWERFAGTVGVPADAFDLDVPPRNTSLGVEQVEVMRRVNIALDGRIKRPMPFARLVKGRLAQQTLGGRPGTPLRLGGGDLAFARERADVMVAELRVLAAERGLDVVGDLGELVVADSGVAESTPRIVPDDTVLLPEVVEGIAGMLVRQHARAGAGAVRQERLGRESAGDADAAELPAPEPAATAGPRRLFLHVGVPKSGTTFLQNVLWRQWTTAARSGVLLPGTAYAQHVAAAKAVKGTHKTPGELPRPWKRLVSELEDWTGSALVSSETMAGASPRDAAALVALLEAAGHEVHVIVTARDMARQLPAGWQENVKQGGRETFGDFVAERRPPGFLRIDAVAAARRWATALPAGRVHLVTVPPPGAPRHALWERFAGVLDLDPAAFDLDIPRDNTSLGVEQVTLLRLVNEALGDRLASGGYGAAVKKVLAHKVLEPRPGRRITLDADGLECARAWSQRQIEELRAAVDAGQVDLVGEMSDLAVPDSDGGNARDATPAEVLEEGVGALADLLVVLDGLGTARAKNA